jgi:hypothetical protein
MILAGFQPAFPESERLQTHALDRKTTGNSKDKQWPELYLMIQFYRSVYTFRFIYENKSVVLYREAIAVSSENHTKHKYTVWAECKLFDPYTL